MFLEGWVGFPEREKGRSQGETPVLGNSKVMGQVKQNTVFWGSRRRGK